MRVLIVITMLLTGCQTIEQLRSEVSSGHVGCPTDQIQTTDHKQLTWTASCKGKKFYCVTGDGTSCKEAI